MFKLSRSFLALTCIILVSSAVSDAQSGQRPLTPGPPTIIDYDPIPKSLSAAWNEVSAVIHAKVISTGPPSIRQGPHPLVQRVAVLDVIEMFKGDSSLGKTPLRLVQFGGTKEANGREVNTAFPFDPLQPGEEVILLLVPSVTGDGSFVAAFGSAGVYRIASDKQSVSVPRSAKHLDILSGRATVPLEELRQPLRELRAKSSRKTK